MTRHMKVEHTFRGWVTRTTTETWIVDVKAAQGDLEAADVKIQEAIDGDFLDVDGTAKLDYTSTETEITITEELTTNQEA